MPSTTPVAVSLETGPQSSVALSEERKRMK
jgi:hypothetical protein